MKYKPPCHRIDGEECKRNLGPLGSEAIPTRSKDLTPISISTYLIGRGQADKASTWYRFSRGPISVWYPGRNPRRHTDGLSADRKLRNHRQHAHSCPGGHERFDRLVLLPLLRLAQLLRGNSR